MITQSVKKTNIANDAGSVSFVCPACQGATISRSAHERMIVSKFVCPQCGFEGPN